MGNRGLQGGWGECVSGWMAGWVWVPSFVACTTLPRRREREWAEAAVTYHVNVSRATQGSLENSPFFAPHPIFQEEAAWSFWATVGPRGGALLDEKGESEREKISQGKVKGALCCQAARYRSNLSISSTGENSAATPLYGTGTIWPQCENCSWLGTVGVQLSRWNTLSPSGRTIPSVALTRKEFLHRSSHNKEERERSRAGGRRSEVTGGEGKGALWRERRALFACDCGQRKSMSYQDMCECV